jgi:micrococcal nuclease
VCAGSRTGDVELYCSILFIFALTLTSVPSLSVAGDFSGPVVSVLDGDTIEVLNGHHTERIRLSGIDCPEKGQAFGKQVTLKTHGLDKYKRILADVILQDGTNVNHMLVKDGWCWWYRKYAPGGAVLEELEKAAREARKGLWVDPQPVAPWVYRKAQRVRRSPFKARTGSAT